MCEEGRHLSFFIFFLSPFNLLILLIKCISNETAVFLFENAKGCPITKCYLMRGTFVIYVKHGFSFFFC